jgi:hypothetical protein
VHVVRALQRAVDLDAQRGGMVAGGGQDR